MGSSKIPRRQLLQGIALGGGLMVAGSACVPPTARLSPDTRPDPTKPEGIDTMPEVEHIIIYMQENHSYDNYFGMLGRGDGFTLDAAGLPTNSNLDINGNPVTVHRATVPNEAPNCSQNWNDTHHSVNGGAMDGFARISPDALKYYDGSFLPFYYGLANTFPIADRWFCSCQGQTHPNRRYLQAATSVGLVETDVSKVLSTPDAPNGTIWDRLNAHAISWVDYAYDLPDIALFPRVLLGNAGRVKPISQFLFDCQYGRLPQVSIVSPGDTAFSEEPEKDIQLGEAYSAMLINAVLQSPTWDKTVMFFCYDEHGGFYDHVPPPAAVPPDNIPPQIDVAKGDSPGGFDRYGVRVPGFVISPFAKADYVSHVVHDHTSILRFIETKFNLGALTYRDANADNLMDSIDFEAKAFLEPPTLPAPADPTGYSTFQSSPGLPGPTAGLHPAALS